MKDEQNQFYSSISKYYSEIFPFNPMQLNFVKRKLGDLSNKEILDIGCATGELASNMVGEGAKVVGIDLNKDLLQQAKNKKVHSKLQFQLGNMLELEHDFPKDKFDAVLCFGNTLVHLPTTDLIGKMLDGVYSVLKPGGQFLMQILNYDYILDERLKELPLIETENIRFMREYKYIANSSIIKFHTQLEIKKENQTVSNQTSLLALKRNELLELLKKSGFKDVNLYSNFKQELFGGKSLPMIVSAVK